MTVAEVELYRLSHPPPVRPLPRVNLPEDVSDGEDDNSVHEDDEEEIPDLLTLPPQDDDIDENERPRSHFRYRMFSYYP